MTMKCLVALNAVQEEEDDKKTKKPRVCIFHDSFLFDSLPVPFECGGVRLEKQRPVIAVVLFWRVALSGPLSLVSRFFFRRSFHTSQKRDKKTGEKISNSLSLSLFLDTNDKNEIKTQGVKERNDVVLRKYSKSTL